MSKQEKNTTTEQQEQKPPKEAKAAKEPRLEIPLWLFERAHRNNVTLAQLVVYSWIFQHNIYGHIIFGKHTYTELWHIISKDLDLGVTGATKLCQELEKKCWIAKAQAEPYNGISMKGYRCLLGKDAKTEQRAEQQKMQLADENAVTEIPSAVRKGHTEINEDGKLVQFNDGTYHLGHQHWYRIDAVYIPEEDRWVSEKGDIESNKQYFPESVKYDRKYIDGVWQIFDTEGQRWCLPGEETERQADF